jgi:RNA polymerase sigma-70 factor (ECF subfamily)
VSWACEFDRHETHSGQENTVIIETAIAEFTAGIAPIPGGAGAQAVRRRVPLLDGGEAPARPRARRVERSREQRFNELIGVHMKDLYRFAYWMSGSQSVAEDLVQETLVRAWKSLDRLKDAKAAKNWLLTIARRENARRFERKHPPAAEVSTEELVAERTDYDTSTEAFALRRALKQLPMQYREPLLMQVLYGYSQREIAEYLGISDAGAGTRLFRARAKLRALL